jgi:hypothetical protein
MALCELLKLNPNLNPKLNIKSVDKVEALAWLYVSC